VALQGMTEAVGCNRAVPTGTIGTLSAPNTRVQRTRSSPSALREPLTRRPLGGPSA
jgi:hypothetical protein